MGFEISFIAHCLYFINPVAEIDKFYFFLSAKVNKVQDIKSPGTSFASLRVKIEKNHIKP
jgi:hypothetical protein